jgi:hypothetical protein
MINNKSTFFFALIAKKRGCKPFASYPLGTRILRMTFYAGISALCYWTLGLDEGFNEEYVLT